MQATNVEELVDQDVKPVNTLLILIGFPLYLIIVFGLLLLLPAGTLEWIEGWAWMFSFTLITTAFYFVINRRDPTVIRNRAKVRKTGVTDEIKSEAGSDKWIYPMLVIFFSATLVVSGLNVRYGWTTMQLVLVIIGFILSIIGIFIINGAQLQNAYASKILDINEKQKLTDTGMYARIRHPLYAGMVLWLLGTPFALGSWYALVPVILMIAAILIRIKYEEGMLIKGMDGYVDYKNRVKYKLIPKLY